MERHFVRELESLKTTIIKMASIVEDDVVKSIQALIERNAKLSAEVIENDNRVDALEIEIDNAIIDLLALQQPLASDLRFIIAAQKINNDLERIGDHAVNIAEAVETFLRSKEGEELLDIPKMAEIAKTMLRHTIDSFIQVDPMLAQSVLENDDMIDELNRKMNSKVIELVRANQKSLECGLELMRVSRNLERIADLTTNIAEDVIFLTQARVVKHHFEEKNGGKE
jgi:phosphate transport system protein